MASLSPLSGILGHRYAAHVLRRASFRYTKAKVDELAGMSARLAPQSAFREAGIDYASSLYDLRFSIEKRRS